MSTCEVSVPCTGPQEGTPTWTGPLVTPILRWELVGFLASGQEVFLDFLSLFSLNQIKFWKQFIVPVPVFNNTVPFQAGLVQVGLRRAAACGVQSLPSPPPPSQGA